MSQAIECREYQDGVEILSVKEPKDRRLEIPETIDHKPVRRIADYACMGMEIEEVQLPETVQSVGKGAFYSCERLRDVAVPKEAVLGQQAFADCPNLERVSSMPGLVPQKDVKEVLQQKIIKDRTFYGVQANRLEDQTFVRCQFRDLDCKKAQNVSFEECRFTGQVPHLEDVRMEQVDFSDAQFQRENQRVQMLHTTLDRLTRVRFLESSFKDVEIYQQCRDTEFQDCQMDHTLLRGELEKVNFQDCQAKELLLQDRIQDVCLDHVRAEHLLLIPDATSRDLRIENSRLDNLSAAGTVRDWDLKNNEIRQFQVYIEEPSRNVSMENLQADRIQVKSRENELNPPKVVHVDARGVKVSEEVDIATSYMDDMKCYDCEAESVRRNHNQDIAIEGRDSDHSIPLHGYATKQKEENRDEDGPEHNR